jgi:hypothetical protein
MVFTLTLMLILFLQPKTTTTFGSVHRLDYTFFAKAWEGKLQDVIHDGLLCLCNKDYSLSVNKMPSRLIWSHRKGVPISRGRQLAAQME